MAIADDLQIISLSAAYTGWADLFETPALEPTITSMNMRGETKGIPILTLT